MRYINLRLLTYLLTYLLTLADARSIYVTFGDLEWRRNARHERPYSWAHLSEYVCIVLPIAFKFGMWGVTCFSGQPLPHPKGRWISAPSFWALPYAHIVWLIRATKFCRVTKLVNGNFLYGPPRLPTLGAGLRGPKFLWPSLYVCSYRST